MRVCSRSRDCVLQRTKWAVCMLARQHMLSTWCPSLVSSLQCRPHGKGREFNAPEILRMRCNLTLIMIWLMW